MKLPKPKSVKYKHQKCSRDGRHSMTPNCKSACWGLVNRLAADMVRWCWWVLFWIFCTKLLLHSSKYCNCRAYSDGYCFRLTVQGIPRQSLYVCLFSRLQLQFECIQDTEEVLTLTLMPVELIFVATKDEYSQLLALAVKNKILVLAPMLTWYIPPLPLSVSSCWPSRWADP